MPVEFREEQGQLVWVRNPFTGTVTYFTDLYKKPNGFRDNFPPRRALAAKATGISQQETSRLGDLEAAQAKCTFCPGNEHLTEEEVLRIPAVGGPETTRSANPWLIRVFYNIVPRIPESCTGGRNESYVVVEDPRHFATDAMDTDDLLCSSMLPVSQFQAVLRTAVTVARRSYENRAVQAVIIRKNQGRESGASQPHVHTQVIGSPEPLQPVELERARLAQEPGLVREILDFADSRGFVIARENGSALYFCPWGTFPSSYEVVCPDIWEPITEMAAEQLDSFASLLHEALGTFGSLPLDYEIHDGPGVPLHAHVNLRRFPYSNIGGTLNLPSIVPAAFKSPPPER